MANGETSEGSLRNSEKLFVWLWRREKDLFLSFWRDRGRKEQSGVRREEEQIVFGVREERSGC